jgi:hypothetical protein
MDSVNYNNNNNGVLVRSSRSLPVNIVMGSVTNPSNDVWFNSCGSVRAQIFMSSVGFWNDEARREKREKKKKKKKKKQKGKWGKGKGCVIDVEGEKQGSGSGEGKSS